MKKKILIIVFAVVLVALIILLVLVTRDKYPSYTCHLESTSTLSIDYKVIYDEDTGEVIEHVITKTYSGSNAKEREDLATMKMLIEQENASFDEQYNGFSYEVLRDNASMYRYAFHIDAKVMDEEDLRFFETRKTVEEQDEYFSTIENLVCD